MPHPVRPAPFLSPDDVGYGPHAGPAPAAPSSAAAYAAARRRERCGDAERAGAAGTVQLLRVWRLAHGGPLARGLLHALGQGDAEHGLVRG